MPNRAYPKFNKTIFGGTILNADTNLILRQMKKCRWKNKAKKYKIRITNHVRNLVKNDSTNVRLGLSVTESINNIGFSKLKRTPNSNLSSAPTMSVLSQLGTILYGTNIPVAPDRL